MAKVKTFIGYVRGPQGEIGPQGPQGIPGITIFGSYDSESALKSEQPTGNAGEAYLVGEDLYAWSKTSNRWVNAGPVKGPQGDPGVYIGSDTPPDTASVWVDQSGDPSGVEAWTFTLEDGTTVTKSVVVVS